MASTASGNSVADLVTDQVGTMLQNSLRNLEAAPAALAGEEPQKPTPQALTAVAAAVGAAPMPEAPMAAEVKQPPAASQLGADVSFVPGAPKNADDILVHDLTPAAYAVWIVLSAGQHYTKDEMLTIKEYLDVRYEPRGVFVKALANGSLMVCLGGPDASSVSDCAGDFETYAEALLQAAGVETKGSIPVQAHPVAAAGEMMADAIEVEELPQAGGAPPAPPPRVAGKPEAEELAPVAKLAPPPPGMPPARGRGEPAAEEAGPAAKLAPPPLPPAPPPLPQAREQGEPADERAAKLAPPPMPPARKQGEPAEEAAAKLAPPPMPPPMPPARKQGEPAAEDVEPAAKLAPPPLPPGPPQEKKLRFQDVEPGSPQSKELPVDSTEAESKEIAPVDVAEAGSKEIGPDGVDEAAAPAPPPPPKKKTKKKKAVPAKSAPPTSLPAERSPSEEGDEADAELSAKLLPPGAAPAERKRSGSRCRGGGVACLGRGGRRRGRVFILSRVRRG